MIKFESEVSENSSEHPLFELEVTENSSEHPSLSLSLSSGGQDQDNIMSNVEPNARTSGVRSNPGADHNSVASLPGLPGNSVAGAASVGPGVPSGSVESSSPSLGASTISTVNTAAGGLPHLPTVRFPAPIGGGAFGVFPSTSGGAGFSTKSR